MKKRYIIIVLFLLCLSGFGIYYVVQKQEAKDKKELFFQDVISNKATLNSYTIYGIHMNLKIHFDFQYAEERTNIIHLVLKDLEGEEQEININPKTVENGILITTSDLINEGIVLEKLKTGEYYLLVKVVDKTEEEEKITYYAIEDKSNLNFNYYTMSNQEVANQIIPKIETVVLKANERKKIEEKKISCISFQIKETTLPEDVYDIVLDPGHGGTDPGAVKGDIYESNVALTQAKALKKELEQLGLKVKLSREDNSGVDAYGENGRGVLPNRLKAKLSLSIHLNSSEYELTKGGVEVYAPTHANLEFASSIADNIVEYASTTYSPNEQWKTKNGVYVKTFTEEDIEEVKKSAREDGYEPYPNLSTNTPYLFMVREIGGIMTHAYVDGRNKDYEPNPYYNSNVTAEGYLIELGFMTYSKDLQNLTTNETGYAKGIAEAVKKYVRK